MGAPELGPVDVGPAGIGSVESERRARLTRRLLLVVLAAALATAPVFLFAEGFEARHFWRVAASNGGAALLCVVLLAVLRKGHVAPVGRALVFGLLALVAGLAWTNGEEVHQNVVNFVLVTVLASVLLGRRALLVVAAIAALVMAAIAWKQAHAAAGEELLEARFESISQFLPSYAVITLVLWFREAPAARAPVTSPPSA
jgi:hypothetical protein